MQTIYVHTLGDSTLDNFYWMLKEYPESELDAKENSVEGQLKTNLNQNEDCYEIVSHAFDGFTTSNVLDGGNVGSVLYINPGFKLTEEKKKYLKDKKINPRSQNYSRNPLDELKKAINEKPASIHYVVISVGGNDFRTRLHNPLALLKEITKIQKRYLSILNEIKSIKNENIRPIVMLQYKVSAQKDQYGIYRIIKGLGSLVITIHLLCISLIITSPLLFLAGLINTKANVILIGLGSLCFALSTYVIPFGFTTEVLSGQGIGPSLLGKLLEIFYRPILKQAKIDGLPVLDLSNTFNPYDGDLYISQIEPSQKGGKLIAEGITHIVKNHDFQNKKSLIYSKNSADLFTSIENNNSKKSNRTAYINEQDIRLVEERVIQLRDDVKRIENQSERNATLISEMRVALSSGNQLSNNAEKDIPNDLNIDFSSQVVKKIENKGIFSYFFKSHQAQRNLVQRFKTAQIDLTELERLCREIQELHLDTEIAVDGLCQDVITTTNLLEAEMKHR